MAGAFNACVHVSGWKIAFQIMSGPKVFTRLLSGTDIGHLGVAVS